MKVKDQEIPEAALELWRDQVLNSSDEDVIRCTISYKFMSTGFRAGKAPASHLRAQLLSMLLSKGEIPVPLLDTLQAVGLTKSLIKVLSVEAIEHLHEDFSGFFGDAFYAALVIDSRDEVRELGIRNLTELGSRKQSKLEKSQAANNVLEKLHLFTRAFSEMIAASGLSEDILEGPRAARDPLNSEILDNLRSDLASQRKELKKSVAANERLNAEVLNLRNKLEKSERARQKALQDCQEVQKSYSELSAVFDQKVEAEILRRLDARIVPWLSSSEGYAAALSSKEMQTLEDQAQKALSLQATDDKLYGTKSKLRSMQSRFQCLRDEVLAALADSMRPRNDLKRVLRQLQDEISRLNNLLDPTISHELSGDCVDLLHQIDCSNSLDEISILRADKTRLSQQGKLNQYETQVISDRIHAKSDIFYREHVRAHPEQDTHWLLYGLPATLVRAQISQGKVVRLIIDGHNVLFSLNETFRVFYENGVPADRARVELQARLVGLSQSFPLIEIDLWFDSPHSSRETVTRQVSVFYSGGQGVNRADDQIVQSVEALATSLTCLVFVVTDDHDLADRSRAKGAHVLGCDEFCSLIQ